MGAGWSKIYIISNWLFNIAYLNILWIIFTILGLGIFGIFPATAATFAITRKWIFLGERDFNLFSAFWKFYCKDYLKLNGFAIIFYIVGFILYYEASFLYLNPGNFQFLIPGVILMIISYVITLTFFFQMFTHYQLKFFQYIKQAFLLAIVSPLEILATILIVIIILGFMLWVPGIIPLFSVSVFVLSMTYISKRRLARIDKK